MRCCMVSQVQASSGELMIGLGAFLRRRCRRLRHFDGGEVAAWLRSVDRALLEHAWQDAPFIGPANVVFVYLLARDAVDPDIVTAGELQAVMMACLYVAFSYVGCEISYPLKVCHSSCNVTHIFTRTRTYLRTYLLTYCRTLPTDDRSDQGPYNKQGRATATILAPVA